jgi:hypothetical protein
MGIFQDLINSRSMTGAERYIKRELQTFVDAGDADAPWGFEGRTSWAVLKVLGLIDFPVAPLAAYSIGLIPRNVSYEDVLVSSDLVRMLANQVAIEDGLTRREAELLVHLDQWVSKPGEIRLGATPVLNAPAIIVYKGSDPITDITTHTFNKNLFGFETDNDGTAIVEMTIQIASSFDFQLSTGAGLTFTVGGVSFDDHKEFSGALNDVNAALNGAKVRLIGGSPSSDSLAMTLVDTGPEPRRVDLLIVGLEG